MFAKKKPVINTSSRSYLQPESLKVHQLVQSPKFNIEKALQEQIQRKRINQQKLARYDHYNSILAAKGIEGCNQNKKQQRSQLNMQSSPPLTTLIPTSPTSNTTKLPRSTFSTQKSQFSKLITSPAQSQFEIQQQKYLQLLKQKNHNLHTKNDQLKSYLKDVNSGVGQLKGILEEVEGNYDKLKRMYRKESGLWLNGEMENSCEESVEFQQQSAIYREDDTPINRHFTLNPNKSLSTQQPTQYPYQPSSTMMSQPQQYPSQTNLQLLQQIETKFQGILKKVSEHNDQRSFIGKKDSPVYELNRIERQLDRIKSVDKVNGNKKPVISNVYAQKGNLQFGSSYLSPASPSQQQFQPYTKLMKSKSSSKLFFS